MAKIVDWDSHIGRRLRLRDLHVFFAVVRQGSLAKAAAQLGVSHPAVSQLMADLEDALGAKLLDRSSRGVSPTVYGRALLTRGRAAFDELRQGIRDIEFLSDPHAGEIRMGCPEGIGAILLPIIDKFSEQYPNVVFDVHEEGVESLGSKLRERSLDFVIQRLRSYPLAESSADNLNVELLFEDELVIVAGGPSPWVRRRKIDLAQLADEPWILSGPPSWNHRIVTEAFTSRGLRMPKVVMKTFSVQIRGNMVSTGRFISNSQSS